MNVYEAKDYFTVASTEASLTVVSLESTSDTGSWMVRALQERAEMRLTWRAMEEILKLEISQGPPGGKIAGWFDFYHEACVDGQLPANHLEGCSFQESVDYAIELSSPVTSKSGSGL